MNNQHSPSDPQGANQDQGNNNNNGPSSRKRGLNQISQQNNDQINQLFDNSDNYPRQDMNYGADDGDLMDDANSAGIIEEHIQEDVDYHDDELDNSEDEIDGEDLLENMEQDYRRQDELDNYEDVGLDDQVQSELSMNQRMAVDDRLNQDQRIREQTGRRPGALLDGDDDEDLDEQEMNEMRRRRMRDMREEGMLDDAMDMNQDHEDIINIVDYDDVKGPVATWLRKPAVIRFISRQFDQFLRRNYEDKIHEMCQNNQQSLQMEFNEFSLKYPTLAIWLAEEPALMLPILNECAFDVIGDAYPDYNKQYDQVFIRVRNLPVQDVIRDIRVSHLNALIKIRGVVTKRTGVFPELRSSVFACVACGQKKGPFLNNHGSVEDQKRFLGQCHVCEGRSFQLDEFLTVYRNYQKWTVQETPGSVPPGRVPRQKEVFILNDLVDSARPGDEVEITGIFMNKFEYNANVKHGFPVFSTTIEANNVVRFGDENVVELTDEDKKAIRDWSKHPNIAEIVYRSMAPAIFGHDFIKKGLTLAMFSGVPKDINDKHRIRGDINMLLLGDPGTAKSQFLKYIEQIYPRVVYTTGKGASAVGLTAGVHRDPVSQEWILEAGALVLADKGICLIDEFDKMNDQDRTSIHEAMEQQTISISKAGIVTSLQARCSVIAAANPINGNYNQTLNFNDNVDLTDPILSRFDLLAVVKDDIDAEKDDALATFVINSHIKNHPKIIKIKSQYNDEELTGESREQRDADLLAIDTELQERMIPDRHKLAEQGEMMPFEMLKKYIIFSKRHFKPKLTKIDQDKVTNFYAEIRRESNIVGGIPIAVRHIESLIRMSEAHAKLHLRDEVLAMDVDVAIELLLDSFIQSQKHSVGRQMIKKFEKYKIRSMDTSFLLLHILQKCVQNRSHYQRVTGGIEVHDKIQVRVATQMFEAEARDYNRSNFHQFYQDEKFKKSYKIDGNEIVTIHKI